MSHSVEQVLAGLPRGSGLRDGAWPSRGPLVLWLLAAHVPLLVAFGMASGRTLGVAMAQAFPVFLATAAGLVAPWRTVRAIAVSIGLVAGSVLLVVFTEGAAPSHLHYLVVLSFVALYQDWRPYVAAVVAILATLAVMAATAPALLTGGNVDPAAAWRAAGVYAGFVAAAVVAHGLLWWQSIRHQRLTHDHFTQAYETERAAVAQLRQTQMVKDELIGVVGHEFRTPLTAIQGFARTLDARFDRMDRETVQTCTQAIEREAKRLTRMVTNLLIGSEEITPSPEDRCSLADTADRVVRDIVETMPIAARHIRVHIPTEHVARVERESAYQLLFNLVDNAAKFAAPDSVVRVSSRGDGDTLVLEVTNVGSPITAADRERIFEAFFQADSSVTRRVGGMGLGLHIARKIVTAYGGRIGVFGEGPVVIFRVWLPRAADDHARADAMPRVAIDLDGANRPR